MADAQLAFSFSCSLGPYLAHFQVLPTFRMSCSISINFLGNSLDMHRDLFP